eukprot:scaffold34616_cov159-Skeletonema_dohrnii-CCMP3373.AAC.22
MVEKPKQSIKVRTSPALLEVLMHGEPFEIKPATLLFLMSLRVEICTFSKCKQPLFAFTVETTGNQVVAQGFCSGRKGRSLFVSSNLPNEPNWGKTPQWKPPTTVLSWAAKLSCASRKPALSDRLETDSRLASTKQRASS